MENCSLNGHGCKVKRVLCKPQAAHVAASRVVEEIPAAVEVWQQQCGEESGKNGSNTGFGSRGSCGDTGPHMAVVEKQLMAPVEGEILDHHHSGGNWADTGS